MGVTGNKVQRSGIGCRARTMTGASPTDLHYGSRGLPAAYRPPGSLGPHKPCANGTRVTINDTIRELVVETRGERRHSGRRVGTVGDMEDIVSFREGVCRKRCHLRVPAEESDEEVTSCSSGSRVLPQTRCVIAIQEGWGIGNGNDAEPCLPDGQCSVGLRGISYLLPLRCCRRRARFPGGAITYRQKP